MNDLYHKWKNSRRRGIVISTFTSSEMYKEAVRQFRNNGNFIEPAPELTEFDISKPKEITVFLHDKNNTLIFTAPVEVPENYQFEMKGF